jgi:hypothetical protein
MPRNRQDPNFLSNINLFNNATGVPSFAQRVSETNAAKSDQAPAKASGAPVAGKENIFTGLCEALNQNQRELVKLEKRKMPDEYVIEFAPPSIGASKVSRPGPQDATTAPMQTSDSAARISNETNKVNRAARTWPVEAGTQIIKVIDDVMRNSSFVTDQQNVEITTTTDPVTGIQVQKLNAKKGTGNFQWYKISVSARPLGYDTIIRDYAYRMTFTITPYAVAQMTSQYFPESRYRGVHKSYQYWFTGANTQILHYEQKYDNAYRLVLSGASVNAQQKTTTDFRDQNRYIFMATSEDQSKGAKNYANEPGDNAASFLYDSKSLSTVKMRIVGDPAWLQQGECGLGISAKTFNFSPFNADGAINYDAQAVMFDVSFNQPTDYNFDTGLMNVNANNRNGLPQEHYTFTAVTCKNFFSKGRFEQEIEGKLLVEFKTNQSNNSRSAATPSMPASTRDTTNSAVSAADEVNPEKWNDGTATQSTGARTEEEFNADNPPSPQPASPPGDPSSSGDIEAVKSVQANYKTGGGGVTPPADAAAAVAAVNSPFTNTTSPFTNTTSPFTKTTSPFTPQKIAKDDS